MGVPRSGTLGVYILVRAWRTIYYSLVTVRKISSKVFHILDRFQPKRPVHLLRRGTLRSEIWYPEPLQ